MCPSQRLRKEVFNTEAAGSANISRNKLIFLMTPAAFELPKSKKVKIQNLRCPGEAEPYAVAPAVLGAAVAIRRAAEVHNVVPAAATKDPVRAR